jgi:hypothetical protein
MHRVGLFGLVWFWFGWLVGWFGLVWFGLLGVYFQ